MAQEGRDEAAIRAELKAYDPHLCLVKQPTSRGIAYQVWYRATDSAANSILTWCDPDGTPRPLSSGLMEEVRKLDKNTYGPSLDPDAMNKAMKEKKALERQIEEEEYIRETEKRGKRSPVFHRGPHLRRDREMG